MAHFARMFFKKLFLFAFLSRRVEVRFSCNFGLHVLSDFQTGFSRIVFLEMTLVSRPWQKKRALKFALKGSESFKVCFELYRCLNPEKSFKSSFKNAFLSFFPDICSTMFRVVVWVQVEFRSLSNFRRCMLFDWLLLLLLLSKFAFSGVCTGSMGS